MKEQTAQSSAGEIQRIRPGIAAGREVRHRQRGLGAHLRVTTDGFVACWGYNRDGQASPPAGKFVTVSAGNHHTCGVKTDGTITCWGYNEDGQASPPGREVRLCRRGAESHLRGKDRRLRHLLGRQPCIYAGRRVRLRQRGAQSSQLWGEDRRILRVLGSLGQLEQPLSLVLSPNGI